MKGIHLHPSGIRIRIEGPWPFITRRSYRLAGRPIVWLARAHRKGLGVQAHALESAKPPFWQSARYNWSVGAIFAVGSFLFMLGSLMSLMPSGPWQPSALMTNSVFFLGSIPFTTAGYLQHFQAANAGDFTIEPHPLQPRRVSLIGWDPSSPGWLSTFTQFLGTIAFNFNTFDSIMAPAAWDIQDALIWMPDMIGSMLFLVSGYLAYIESGHRYWSWRPRELTWQIAFVNLIGCIAFMTAAILAYVPNGPEAQWIATVSIAHLFVGALCFFIGALLTMRESKAT
ncbi:hypothetical protein OSH11_13505 [Kaistia dalseonensis]|uniref:YrhK domain-containing protein n=1 Tax=Kaistia dalseonensis TaxID=410840 RepID=A0ABU0H7N4_9HYPH|nr:hypothetical protein [Kaistia dalseonensis]MCX5495725.1 hypothetical protein [Kaistia dalseonensis]MDQ0438322.1 hypothetical protein [Kaistia dalseonensis]